MGGRGAKYGFQSGEERISWSNGIGTKVADTLKEAIGKKGKSIDMTKAYKDANPNYDRTQTYAEYTMNCQRCVVAYELRRRGYDVTAQPTYNGDELPTSRLIANKKTQNQTKWGNWQRAFQHSKSINVGAQTSAGIVSNINKKMKAFGNGSRGVVSITYVDKNGKPTRSGHVFNVERRKGTTYYVDAQSGERIRAKQFFDITNRATVTLVRTDNLRISEKAKAFVTSEDVYKRKRK